MITTAPISLSRRHLGLRVPMRDGVELAADLYLPPAGIDGGPYPAS